MHPMGLVVEVAVLVQVQKVHVQVAKSMPVDLVVAVALVVAQASVGHPDQVVVLPLQFL